MFAESMLETSWAHRTRRGWTTLTSFGVQAVVIGLLLLIPLLQTVGLPSGRVLPTPISWGAPPAPPHVEHLRADRFNQSNLSDNVVIAPRSIPPHIAMLDETMPPPQVSYNTGPGVEGGTGVGSRDGVWGSLSESMRPVVAMPTSVVAKPTFRTSNMLEGSLIRRVQPVYPGPARIARVQGPVVLAAIISKDGTMQHVQLISGHPMLVPAAIEAVRQWRYKPYILNGEAIEVETQITVNFVLGVN